MVRNGVKKGVCSFIVTLKRIVEILHVRHNVNGKVRPVILHFEDSFDFFVEELVSPVDVPRLLINANFTEIYSRHHYPIILPITEELGEQVSIDVAHLTVVLNTQATVL